MSSDANTSSVSTAPQDYSAHHETGRRFGLNLVAFVTNAAWGAGMSAIVEDFTPGEATLILEGVVSQGTSVKVRIRDFAFEGEILYCEKRGDQYEAHVSIDDLDEMGLRRTPRFPLSFPALVSAAGFVGPLPATIVDVSGDGFGMEMSAALLYDTPIAVESDSNIALGIVRYCQEIPVGKFRVGVQLHHIVKREKRPVSTNLRSGLITNLLKRLSGARHPGTQE